MWLPNLRWDRHKALPLRQMIESPIFVKTYELLLWLVPRTLKLPREHRFPLALRLQTNAHALQRALLVAAKMPPGEARRDALRDADVELSELKLNWRLANDLSLLDARTFENGARLTNEVGRLLGGWLNKSGQNK